MKTIILFCMMATILNAKEKYINHLIDEDSPYLLQHAHNPVNWFAWNEKAFKKAKEENKLIFLSIGYSTCHWCHVMEKESFENEEVAKVLNKYFVSIKVDREEMPHVDKYYQNIYNLLNRKAGGWPLTIILTPEKKAFFAATYIPIHKNYGRKGILGVLNEVENRFKNKKENIYELANEIENVLQKDKTFKYENKQLDISLINKFIKQINDNFDKENFGIGTRPKFPHASTIDTLLDIYKVSKNKEAFFLATNMLIAMGNGGIYDQIEGGFYRYSVDENWVIPHFEKMLYTNAELLNVYAKAYEITKDDFYKNIATGIINFVEKRFEKEKLLYSASDADSLSENNKEKEGAYFVFNYDEVVDYLKSKNYKKDEIKKVTKYFNITFEGNFENGLSNPYLSNSQTLNNLLKVKEDLTNLREKKPYAFIDNKILTSWNAMYISALIQAKSINENYGKKALKLLNNLLDKLYIDGILFHQRLVDKKPKVKALLEDYAFLIEALLKAYDFTLEDKYLNFANKLNKMAINKFYKDGIWFMSTDEFHIKADIYDTSYKSSLSVMLDNIEKLALLNEDLKLDEIVKKTLKTYSFILSSNPISVPWLLRDYIGLNKGYISLKASKEMLIGKKLIDYPFLLKKEKKEKKYLACKIDNCFVFGKNLKVVLKEIEKNIK